VSFRRSAEHPQTLNPPIAVALAAVVAISLANPGPAAGVPPTTSPAESLTVRECVARARRLAPEPRVALVERDAAALDSTATFRARRAALFFQAGATVAPEHFYDPALTNLGDYAFKLRLEAPVFDAGARDRSRRRSALAVRESQATLEQSERDAGLRAGALAIEWLRLNASSRAEIQSVEWLDHLASVMDAGVRSGMRGRADATRATLERDAVAAELDLTRRDMASTARALARELGVGDDLVSAVRDEPIEASTPPSETDSLELVRSMGAAPEVRLADLTRAERRLDAAAASQASAWRVDVAADAGLAGTDLTRAVPGDISARSPDATFTDRLRRDLGASVALQFRRPLLDRAGRPSMAARAASSRAQDLRWSAEVEAQRRLGLELLSRWRSAAMRYGVAREVAARADEHLLRLESLHAAGSATLLELLDARRALDDARARLTDARADALTARLEAEVRK
jgi:outer membrane protein TolC